MTQTGKILAIVFHPVFLFFYLIGGIVFSDFSFAEERWRIIGIAFLVTVLIPSLFTWFTQKNLFLPNKNQRFVPLLFGAICYLLAAWLLRTYGLPAYVQPLLIAVAISLAIIGIISLKWKISMHGNGMGCMAGLIVYLIPHTPYFYGLAAVLLLIIAIILSQRILSGAHTFWQVAIGFVLGLVITLGVLTLA